MVSIKAKKLLVDAINFFDIGVNSRVDLVSEGDACVYVDGLGNKVQPIPDQVGHNLYYVHGPEQVYRQEIHFQSGPFKQGVNGLSNEALLSIALHRIYKQNESFPSPYNTLTIYLLQAAITALEARLKLREDYGILDSNQVNPDGLEDTKVMNSLSIINSIGIIANLVIKFDSAYGLQVPTKIHQLLETLIERLPEDQDTMNIASAFSFISSSVAGSGIFRAFASIGSQFIKEMNKVKDDQQKSETDPTNQSNG